MATIVGPVTLGAGLRGGVSAAYVTATGVIKAAPGVLAKIVCNAAGSITVADSATDSGGNALGPFAMTAGQVLELDWPCAAGISVSAVSGADAAFALSFT